MNATYQLRMGRVTYQIIVRPCTGQPQIPTNTHFDNNKLELRSIFWCDLYASIYVCDYTKGGTDIVDQKIISYSIKTKSRKWTTIAFSYWA